MLKLIPILFILIFGCINIVRAQDQYYDSTYTGEFLIGEYKFWAPTESLSIADIVSISWKDGIIDVIYYDSSKVTSTAQIFFDWIKQYIEGNYYLLKKDDYEFIDAYQYEMYFKLKFNKR